jgi:hypothetical protein
MGGSREPAVPNNARISTVIVIGLVETINQCKIV